MAYDLQVSYEGYHNDFAENARDKMEFERERLIDIKDPSFIDTFEKFIDYSKEENENDIKMINQLQAKLNLTYKNNQLQNNNQILQSLDE